jgi:predicted membrane channel-forming protein YqfA (hemolysin III family)
MEKTTRQKLLPSLFIFILLLTQGVIGLINGIENHQTWRVVLAATGIAILSAGIILVLVKTRQSQKA